MECFVCTCIRTVKFKCIAVSWFSFTMWTETDFLVNTNLFFWQCVEYKLILLKVHWIQTYSSDSALNTNLFFWQCIEYIRFSHLNVMFTHNINHETEGYILGLRHDIINNAVQNAMNFDWRKWKTNTIELNVLSIIIYTLNKLNVNKKLNEKRTWWRTCTQRWTIASRLLNEMHFFQESKLNI